MGAVAPVNSDFKDRVGMFVKSVFKLILRSPFVALFS